MKMIYEKPVAEVITFQIEELVMNEPDIDDEFGSTEQGGGLFPGGF